jgi:hypothetical protein
LTVAALRADVLPAGDPGQCREALIETGTITITITVTGAQGDRTASQFSVGTS